MNLRSKFGIREVIAMIAGSTLIVVLDFALKYNDVVYPDTVNSVLIAVLSALFGSPTGIVVSIAFSFAQAAILDKGIGIVSVLTYLIIACFIGHYADGYGVFGGRFLGKSIVLFVFSKLMAEILAWFFFQPLLQFLISRENLFDMISRNMKTVVIITIADAVIIPVFMLISNLRKWSTHEL